MIKEEYINPESLDDNSLLMQYFRKHDADNNNLLDGLELLKALAKMDCKFVKLKIILIAIFEMYVNNDYIEVPSTLKLIVTRNILTTFDIDPDLR